MELDNYLKSEQDVEEAYDFQCRCDLEASNTDKMILKIPRLSVGWDSTVDNEIGAWEIADEEVIGCCCIVIVMQLMRDLELIDTLVENSNLH